jgi:hypothetical protein
VKIRFGLAVAAAAAGVSLVAGAAPAFASGPPVPAGCTFDQAIGVETCVTATTGTTSTVGPFTTNDVPVSTTFAGVTGAQLCDLIVPGLSLTGIRLAGLTFDETTTTTTTIERHGLNGKVFDTSTTTSTVPTALDNNEIFCDR